VSGSPAERRAVALAGHTGDDVTARAALRSGDASTRALGLSALARLDRLDATSLAAALGDPDAAVRRRACELAAGRGDVSLLAALDDPDPSVVETAAFACGEQAEPTTAVVARLTALATDHRDALVREAAVAALGAIGAPAGLPAILAATSDKPAVRRRAVIALAPFDGPDVDAALERARSDRDWQVRQAAEDLSE
jgi:HEAT repeat protein